MNTVEVSRALTQDEAKTWKNKRVDEHTPTDLPSGAFTAVDAHTGAPFLLVAQATPDDTERVRAAIMAYRKHFSGVVRAGGMRSKSSTFGFSAPSAVMQRLAPSAASWAWQHPDSHTAVCDFAAQAQTLLTQHGPPNAIGGNAEARTTLHPDWRIADTAWTSGIVNDTAGLYYHYDRNNIPGTWSAMIVVRAGTRGGHLHIADYDLTLPCRDGDVVFFPGMDLMHGVTPITTSLKGGYRFTAVYYSVKRFQNIPGATQALDAAQTRRSALEDDLLARQREQGMIK